MPVRAHSGLFVVAAMWAIGTVIALLVTLPLVGPARDVDGLNNLLQIPFGLPWFLLPLGTDDHGLDAFIAAGMGLLNSGLILRVGLRRSHR